MSNRHALEQHRNSLGEIREIMNSMKTLAYMETRKLSRFLEAQHTVVQTIEAMAADLLSFYPGILPAVDAGTSVYLLLGSERGFCGDFNRGLIKLLDSRLAERGGEAPMLILTGRKLAVLLDGDARVHATLGGASVAEEVTGLITQLSSELSALQDRHGMLDVFCLSHSDTNEPRCRQLLPPFRALTNQPQRFPHPPLLNQSPREFLVELTEHYVFAGLHEMLYSSLMAENYNRVSHLEGAVQQLETKSEDLARRCNALRQEEIIEEIEVLLLSA